jgi:hypothetical protein
MPPIAFLAVGLAATAAAGAMSYVGQRQQAKATEAAAEFNAKVAENEAIRVEQERSEQARRTRIENRRLLGKQRALVAKSGVTMAGSPLELMAETAGELELGVLDMNRAAQAKQEQLRSQATLTRFEGAQQAKGLRRQAMGSLIGTAGQMSMMAYSGSQSGMFGGGAKPPSSGKITYSQFKSKYGQ